MDELLAMFISLACKRYPLKIFALISFLICHSVGLSLYGQSTRQYSFSDQTTMQLQGTSTLHDWTCQVTRVEGSIALEPKMLARRKWTSGSKIGNLRVSVPIASIRSPRGAAMEKKLSNALLADQHPAIVFVLSRIRPRQEDATILSAEGTLSVAGVDKPAVLIVKAEFDGNGQLSFSGTYAMNMRNFGIEPPSAMFGQIVSGDNVTISFNLQINTQP